MSTKLYKWESPSVLHQNILQDLPKLRSVQRPAIQT